MIAPPEAPSTSRASSPRISQEFYDRPPVYSQPPLPSLPPLEVVALPSRKRRVLSVLLFGVVFVPAIAVLVKAIAVKYDGHATSSAELVE